MPILVTGVSGYVGAALVPRLRLDGHAVRGFARSAARVAEPVDELVEGDAVSGAGLDRALDGVEVAYYLIHSMEGAAAGAFPVQERAAAERFAAAARAAGVRRIVYLGGLVPRRPPRRATSPRGWRSRRPCSPPRPSRSRCARRSSSAPDRARSASSCG